MMQPSGGSQFLITKLHIPRARSRRVERPRLFVRLDEALLHPLTLICAPPGFGKTTLLSEWIPHSEKCVAWLSLDDADNDPARFWAYFIAAVQTLDRRLGENALARLPGSLHASLPQPHPIETVLTALLNDIAAFHDEFALVLEDYHTIESQPVHDGLIFLIDHLPRQMHLILTSRLDPPFPLARMRVRNQLAEIRAADLRFTPGEAALFLNQVMELSLSAEDIDLLEARTEGWVAGLQLAALAMHGRDDPASFIPSFTGSNRYILSYLVEEVVNRQPDYLQTFLLQTSILDRMTASLCAALSRGLPDGEAIAEREAQTVLEHLEQANLFLVPLDDEQGWYRYHHLFRDVLYSRLQAAHNETVPNLHVRAAGWFESNGLLVEAIHHALAAEDWGQAVHMIAEAADAMAFTQGQFKTVLAWLQSLPDAVLRSQPRLILIRGWMLLTAGSIEDVEKQLLEAERALPALEPARRLPLEGEIAALKAMIASYRREITRTIELCRLARQQLPEGNAFLRAAVANALGLAYRFSGRVVDACQAFSEAISLGQAAGNIYIMMDSVVGLAGMQMLRGQLRAAEETCRLALRFADERAEAGGHLLFDAGFPYIRLGVVLRERNDLEPAEQFIIKGIELGRQGGNLDIVITGHGFLAGVRQAQGDPAGARAAMRTVEELAVSFNNRLVLIEIAARSARLSLTQGDLEAAQRWEQEYASFTDKDPAYLGEFAEITLVRLRLAEKRFAEALELLEQLREDAEAAGRMGSLIELLALEALARAAQGDLPGGRAALERALALAEPEGYVRMFIDEGDAMRLLISDFRLRIEEQPAHSPSLLSYIDQLLAAFPGRTSVATPINIQQSKIGNLFNSLSERELEVLRLIEAGLTNQEIAGRLVIAVSTVKSHINSLYSKLGARNRVQAIAIARDLGLLSD